MLTQGTIVREPPTHHTAATTPRAIAVFFARRHFEGMEGLFSFYLQPKAGDFDSFLTVKTPFMQARDPLSGLTRPLELGVI